MDSLERRRLIGKEVLEESGVGVQLRASRVPLKESAFVQYTRIWGALRQVAKRQTYHPTMISLELTF